MCPCAKCACTRWWDRNNIRRHLLKWGFRPYYETWTLYGERIDVNLVEEMQTEQRQTVAEESVEVESPNDMVEMVVDGAGCSQDWAEEELPNPKSQEFYDMMKGTDESLWDGCEKEHMVLPCVIELLSIKADCAISKKGFNHILSVVKKWLPKENRLPSNQYRSMVKPGKNSVLCTPILPKTLEICILGYVQMVSLLSTGVVGLTPIGWYC